jgi:hypothetical protein
MHLKNTPYKYPAKCSFMSKNICNRSFWKWLNTILWTFVPIKQGLNVTGHEHFHVFLPRMRSASTQRTQLKNICIPLEFSIPNLVLWSLCEYLLVINLSHIKNSVSNASSVCIQWTRCQNKSMVTSTDRHLWSACETLFYTSITSIKPSHQSNIHVLHSWE